MLKYNSEVCVVDFLVLLTSVSEQIVMIYDFLIILNKQRMYLDEL